ncbi:MAG: YbhB/YbcL family Raf kinase inhibitor-like protein [Candidatus Magasanikbacteria bacterium]
MRIRSTAFEGGESIPSQCTCDGENFNPELLITEVPPESKSLVLIVDDPDAIKPAGKIWVHWTVWNIDPSIVAITEKSVPNGATEGTTDYDKPGWSGPCPPDGEHTYHFKLYALDIVLDLPSSTRKPELEEALAGHVLEKTVLYGKYNIVESRK